MSTDLEDKSDPDCDQQSQLDAESKSPSNQEAFLTIKQAAAVLGKSIRALERSIIGRWGNRLPEGWSARRVPTANGVEWRIVPPPGFVLTLKESSMQDSLAGEELFLQQKVEAARLSFIGERLDTDSQTIIIDRSKELEQLLFELFTTQKQLSEERRLRLEDMRLISKMHDSMRLLEDRAAQTASLKSELADGRNEIKLLKDQYRELLNRPWWKRLFAGSPQK